MIDLFADVKEQPKLYIADVTINVKYQTRVNSKITDERTIKLERIPIVLADNEIPTKKSENNFFKKVYKEHIHTGRYENARMRIVKLENVVFSSNLAYEFDYDKH